MNQPTNQATSGKQTFGYRRDASDEAEDYWDRLTDDDRQLIWLTASGRDDHEVAAAGAQSPQKVAKRYRALLLKLGLDDRLSLVLAAVARTARAPLARARV